MTDMYLKPISMHVKNFGSHLVNIMAVVKEAITKVPEHQNRVIKRHPGHYIIIINISVVRDIELLKFLLHVPPKTCITNPGLSKSVYSF